MKINTKTKEISELLTRGSVDIIDYDSFRKKLLSGKKLRIKHGVDPTGPKIHLGRAIQFQKLRLFQEMGHQVVLVIGDFTAQIGDASDKQAMRRPLSPEEIRENMKGYKKQIGKILDMSKTEVRYNSQWLGRLSAKELIRLSTHFTAQQLIQRRNFKERWKAGRPIGLHELDYPLLQGYDSVEVRADIEIGGTDQLFNLLAGREIQSIYKQPAQDIMTLKMLTGLDGRKMSTSWGNIITIVDSPEDMYGKIMSMKDDLIMEYFELCLQTPLDELEALGTDLKKGRINPQVLKKRLAKEIIALYYDKKAAEKAEKEFIRVFKERKNPLEIPEINLKKKELSILDLLVKTKLASSKTEAKRLILQKGVKIDGKLQNDWQAMIKIKKGTIVQVGKRRFVRLS